ncbi:hypothetical protein A9D46_14820 [Photobacterium damselae subsp. damselae]|uniref:hypothetical protein n=1 Tax=Photobacterium damselae TaxID=38293 RepID=UPI00084A9404|nr:hypothetical protein [Photobacterium damselae]OEC82334.1 hypothetical protein A9D46_14820 [Photobacterium damselae subsp. damselae]
MSWFGDAWDSVTGAVGDFVGGVSDTIVGVVDDVKDVITSVGGAADATTSTADKVQDAVNGVGGAQNAVNQNKGGGSRAVLFGVGGLVALFALLYVTTKGK